MLLLGAGFGWAGGGQEGGSQGGEAAAESEARAAGDEPTEIYFWHAFSDQPRSSWIEDRAAEFNEMQSDYEVIVERKGSYRETLQAAVLAARQGDPPHAAQIFEIGSQLALDSGIFKPIGEIGQFEADDYIEPVLNYYTIEGQVNSIPFTSSSPIL
jgi:sn-glycerol 3-phosphate transport system substrate-binding protein